MSPIGYFFTLIAPGNATVLTSSMTFVICAFANGYFGIKASALIISDTVDLRWILHISPGYNAFLLVVFGAALQEPQGTMRWAIIRELYNAKMLPENGEVAQRDPHFDWSWHSNALRNLALFGLALRILTLLIFYCRSTYTFRGTWTHAKHNVSRFVCKRLKKARESLSGELESEKTRRSKSRPPPHGGTQGTADFLAARAGITDIGTAGLDKGNLTSTQSPPPQLASQTLPRSALLKKGSSVGVPIATAMAEEQGTCNAQEDI